VRSPRPCLVGLAALAALLVLGGCFTGKRPTFVERSDEPTGDTAVDQIVERLELPADGSYTATYDIIAKYGGAPFAATVARDDTRTSVTIGDVRYLQGPDGTQTCTVSTGACASGINEAAISNTGVLHTFSKAAAADRLRREASTMTVPGEAFEATIGDQQADCVKVTGAGGPTQFCVLDSGLLASQDVAEVNISLTTLSPTVNEALFTPSGV